MTERKPHMLHVVDNDPEHLGDEITYSVTCPHDRDDFDRPCVTFYECGCVAEDPYDIEDDPCPKSPTGHHQMVNGGPGALCAPSRHCFVADNDHLQDEAAGMPPGDHAVDFEVEDFEYLRLCPLGVVSR
jgi:hypothetical protein